MKIGIVCYPTFGGSGVIATELGIGLSKKGHEVHFITYKRPVRLSSFQENIFFHEVNPLNYELFEYTPYETALASKIVDVTIHEKLDLLHVHYAIPHATAAYLAQAILKSKQIYLPFITTLHGTDITLIGTDKSYSPVIEFSINESNGVTAVSESLKQQTLDYFNIQNEVRVIYNFVNFERFSKTNKEHFKNAIAPDGEKILVHTSNFRPVKRVQDVIHVFKKVRSQIPSKLLLIGDGPERRSMENLCREMGVCEDIRFLGKQEAVEELLAVADLFLLPSQKESFGLAALEAMACEVPVISSNAGGIPEANIHGVTGYNCEVGDIDQMSQYAIELLADDDKLVQFKKAARKQAEIFNLERILNEYQAYYSEVIDNYTLNLDKANAETIS